MGNNKFDPAKLIALDGLDKNSAIMQFGGYQSFFDGLSRFIEESEHYLQGYNPTVVIYEEDTRNAFLAETKQIRNTLISLGMIRSAVSLSDLEDAIRRCKPKELEDGLLVFYSEMEIMARRISSAISDK
jgi:hypothetical protein